MQSLIKTLFGDKHTLAVAAASLLVALAILHSPAAIMAGLIFPVCLLASAAYLAGH